MTATHIVTSTPFWVGTWGREDITGPGTPVVGDTVEVTRLFGNHAYTKGRDYYIDLSCLTPIEEMTTADPIAIARSALLDQREVVADQLQRITDAIEALERVPA